MIDSSRHFIPVDEILQTIDAMYAAKLNVFHWHIVDSPSFPYESEAYPELSVEGSWAGASDLNSSTYSQADIKAVAARCEARFVKLVLEIDTPAHTLAVAKSHPEMMADCWKWMATSK